MLPHTADTTGYNYCMHSETNGKQKKTLILFEFPKENHLQCCHWTNNKLQPPVPRIMLFIAYDPQPLRCNQCIILQGSLHYCRTTFFNCLITIQEGKHGWTLPCSEISIKKCIGSHWNSLHTKQKWNRNSHLELKCMYVHSNSVHYQNKSSWKRNNTVALGNRERANSHWTDMFTSKVASLDSRQTTGNKTLPGVQQSMPPTGFARDWSSYMQRRLQYRQQLLNMMCHMLRHLSMWHWWHADYCLQLPLLHFLIF